MNPLSDTDVLGRDTAMGAVTLAVSDLDAMIAYYRDGIRLDLLSLGDGRATLGRGAVPLVVLQHAPGLTRAAIGAAGLYHTAILFDTRADLAAALYSVARAYPRTFVGSADHLVSLAFYLTDPEGNGVELYWDRARTEWSWTHGRVKMGGFALDPGSFVREHITPAGLEGRTAAAARIGHVHLSVGDVDTAKRFYTEQLGFAVTAELGDSALFVSAGGYHHHMAMNVWESRGAGVRAPALGLAEVEIHLPTGDELGAVAERMRHFGVGTRDDGRAVRFDDPWGNRLELSVPSST